MYKKLYKELAKKYGITPEAARKACESQFEFTSNMIKTGDDPSIRLQYLGLFKVKKGRRDVVQRKKIWLSERKKLRNAKK